MENQIVSLTINSKELQKAVNLAGKGIIANPIVPILECVLFEVKTDGKIILTGADANITVSTIAYSQDVDIEEDQSVAVPFALLSQLLATLPSTPIEFQFFKDELPGSGKIKQYEVGLDVIVETDQYHIPCFEGSDYLVRPKFEAAKKLKIKSGDIGQALAMVGHLTLDDQARPALNGVFVDVEEDKISFVGLNGFYMGLYEIKASFNERLKFTLPNRFVKLIQSILPEEETLLNVSLTDKMVKIGHGDWQVISSLIEEPFVAYRDALKTGFTSETRLDADELKSVLKRAMLFSNQSVNTVTLNFTGDNLFVVSEHADVNRRSSQDLRIEEPIDGFEIATNAKNMSILLSKVSGVTELKVISHKMPIYLFPKTPEGEKLTYFIMPVMTPSHQPA